MKKFIVFDLDGTLINTAQGITKAVNNTLLHFNYPYQYSIEEVESFLGNGAWVLYQKVTKKAEVDRNEYAYFQIEYVKCQGISEVFPKVIETLQTLINKGFYLIIFSNKPDGALQFLVHDKLHDINWTAVQGNTPNYPTKPDPTCLFKVLDSYDLRVNSIGYYVGDCYVDCLTARNAHLKSVIVTYGYGDYSKIDDYEPDYKIARFEELLEIL